MPSHIRTTVLNHRGSPHILSLSHLKTYLKMQFSISFCLAALLSTAIALPSVVEERACRSINGCNVCQSRAERKYSAYVQTDLRSVA